MRKRRSQITKALSSAKVIALGLMLVAASCAPKSNSLRNVAGPLKSPEFYQNFDNWEEEEEGATFENVPEQHNHGFPGTYPDDSATATAPTNDGKTPEQDSAANIPTPQPEAAGPSTRPNIDDTPSDLPNADANYPRPARESRTPRQRPQPETKTPREPEVEVDVEPTRTPSEPRSTKKRESREPREPRENKNREAKPKSRGTGKASGNCMSADAPCFPIAGKNWFMDGFGAPRSGGRRHAGIDIFADKLTPVVAVEDGVIDIVKIETRGLSGTYVGINHGNGVRTLYMHLNNDSPGTNDGRGHGVVPGIKVGMHVKKGQHIGWVGNSGNAEKTPPHLHFEMRVSDNRNAIRMREFYPTNPFKFLRDSEPKKTVLAFALNY